MCSRSRGRPQFLLLSSSFTRRRGEKTPGSGVEAQNKVKAKCHTLLSYLSINTHGPSVFGLFQSVWSVAPNSSKSLRVTRSLFSENGEEVSLSSLIVFSRGSDYLLPSSQQHCEFINEAHLAEWRIESTEQYAAPENRTYSRVISPTEETGWTQAEGFWLGLRSSVFRLRHHLNHNQTATVRQDKQPLQSFKRLDSNN